MKQVIAGVLVWLVGFAASGREDAEQKSWHPIAAAALIEGVLISNAWMASENPHVYGTVGALLFPIGAAEADSDEEFWVALTATESIAVYNLAVVPDEYSKSEIFKNNLIAWHAALGVMGLTHWLLGDPAEESLAFSFRPERQGGGMLMMTYRF